MTLDFRLRHLQQRCDPQDRLHVLLQFKDDVTALHSLGCRVTSVAGDVASVYVSVRSLDSLKEHPEVVYVEASRPLRDETDVSAVAINLVDPATLQRVIPSKGFGALIGVIDSGFDLAHPCFSNVLNKTRVLAAWDQVNLDQVKGEPPPEFCYGIEYTTDFINKQLSANKPLVVRSQQGAGAHGTFVAGIAAGNGKPDGIYRGMAPDADLILVTYRNDVPAGGSAFILDALDFIRRRACALDLPVVVNISQGDGLGAHDGTSLLERAIDNMVGQGRVLVVVSAGNGRGQPGERPTKLHARGAVEHGRDFVLPFSLMPSVSHPVDGDTIELWYGRGDRFAAALRRPGGETSCFVEPGTSEVIEFPAGNRAHVYSEINHPTNGDNHIGIILEKGDGWEAGTWGLILRGEEVRRGEFDAWADRPNGSPTVNFERYQSDSSTVTLPGNARRAITVGGFISRPVENGETGDIKGGIALGSSIGPTRDGRVKPDIAAPSTLIMVPRLRSAGGPDCYIFMRGTSMAAPHVTGVVALLWSLQPELTARQIRTALYSTARHDTFTGATPNNRWGSGKLDAGAAYKSLSAQPRNGETHMKETRSFEMRVSLLSKDKKSTPLTVKFDVSGDEVVGISAQSTRPGERYEVSLFVKLKKEDGGDECWVCLNAPCPPNQLTQINPCPGTNPPPSPREK